MAGSTTLGGVSVGVGAGAGGPKGSGGGGKEIGSGFYVSYHEVSFSSRGLGKMEVTQGNLPEIISRKLSAPQGGDAAILPLDKPAPLRSVVFDRFSTLSTCLPEDSVLTRPFNVAEKSQKRIRRVLRAVMTAVVLLSPTAELKQAAYAGVPSAENNAGDLPAARMVDNVSPAISVFATEREWIDAWLPHLEAGQKITPAQAARIREMHSLKDASLIEPAAYDSNHYIRMAAVNMLTYRKKVISLARVLDAVDEHGYVRAEPDVRMTAVRAYVPAGGDIEYLLDRPLNLDDTVEREVLRLALERFSKKEIEEMVAQNRFPHRTESFKTGLSYLEFRKQFDKLELDTRPYSLGQIPSANGVGAGVYHIQTGRMEFWNSIFSRIKLGEVSRKISDNFGWKFTAGGSKAPMSWESVQAGYREGTSIIEVNRTAGAARVTEYYFLPFNAGADSQREASLVMAVRVESAGQQSPVVEPVINIEDGSARVSVLPEEREGNAVWKGVVITPENQTTQYADVSPRALVARETQWWQEIEKHIRYPEGLTPEQRKLYTQSYITLLMAQHPDGPIVASFAPATAYRIPWVRDMNYALWAMLDVGLRTEAEKGLEFLFDTNVRTYGPDSPYFFYKGAFRGTQGDRTVSLTRYDRYDDNGILRWSESCDPINENADGSGGDNNRNVEFDGLGLALISMGRYLRTAREQGWDMANVEKFVRRLWPAVSGMTADLLSGELLDESLGLIKPDSGFYERHNPGRRYANTSLLASLGLREAAVLAEFLGHDDTAVRYREASSRIKTGVLRHLVARDAHGDLTMLPMLEERNPEAGTEALTVEAVALDFLDLSVPDEYELASGIIKTIRTNLRVPGTLGIRRSTEIEWHGLSDWFFADMRVATALVMMGRQRALEGDRDEAARLFAEAEDLEKWVRQWGVLNHGGLAEQVRFDYAQKRLFYEQPNMAGYGGGLYILTLNAMKKAQSELKKFNNK